MAIMLSSLKRVYWRALDAASSGAAIPSILYACAYLALRLNVLYHAFGMSARLQIRLIPKRLWLTRKLMHQPYLVRVADIRWGGRPDDRLARVPSETWCGWIVDGSWDLADKQPIDQYLTTYLYSNTTFQILRDGIPYTNTAQYREMVDAVKNGNNDWRARGCRTVEDVRSYFENLERTYRAIEAHGYKTQAELGSSRWFDEIKVFIDRNGEIHKQQGAGHHRLAMAKILNIDKVPVVVIGVHRIWALAAQAQFGRDVITSTDLKIRKDIAQQ